MLALEQYVSAILRGDYDVADVSLPLYPRRLHHHALRLWRRDHDLPPDTDPEELCRAEGLRFQWASVAQRCGFRSGTLIVMAYHFDPRVRGLLIQHERQHAALDACGYHDHVEADAWLATAAAVREAVQHRGGRLWSQTYRHAPEWFLRICWPVRAA